MVDVVALFEFHPCDADPAAALLAERVDGDALQIAAVGDGDHHLLLGYEVLYLEIDALLGRDRRPAIVRVGRPDLAELFLDDPVDLGLVGQDALQILDLLAQVTVLLLELPALHSGEPLQPEVEDGLRLALGEPEPHHQVLARRLHAARAADGSDDLVEVLQRDEQAFEDVRPRPGSPELVARPARHYLELVGYVVPQGLPIGKRPRHAVDECNQVHPEALLHLGVLVEVVEDDLGHGLALQFDHYAHAVPVRLVAQVGDVLELAVLDQLGDLLQEVALVDLVRDLRDHDLGLVALDLLGVGLGLHPYGAPPGLNIVASTTSPRLWGGILVAIPTAMPSDPLTSRLGNRAGKTSGCFRLSSKFGTKSTVSAFMSLSISVAMRVSRASVYLIAPGGSPSTLPKLPWPSTSGYLSAKSWAMRASAS